MEVGLVERTMSWEQSWAIGDQSTIIRDDKIPKCQKTDVWVCVGWAATMYGALCSTHTFNPPPNHGPHAVSFKILLTRVSKMQLFSNVAALKGVDVLTLIFQSLQKFQDSYSKVFRICKTVTLKSDLFIFANFSCLMI